MASQRPSTWPVVAAAAGGALAALLLARWRPGRSSATSDSTVAIIVPGGGLTLEGAPTAWVRARLREASRQYHTRRASGESAIIVTLSGGTPHKPMPVDPKSGFQVYEAEGNAKCLIRDFEVPAEHVFEENWSLDTIGNAYLLRAIHTDVAGWRRLVIVNNDFHMMRTRTIFEKVFSLPPMPDFGQYSLEFITVPDDGVEGEVLAARKEREAKSAEGFRKNTAAVTTMPAMHKFIFSDHMAYASKRLLRDRDPVDPKALQTY